MKALSIRQPFAGAIVLGLKDVENRRWHTSYRGPVLIHSTAYPSLNALELSDSLRGLASRVFVSLDQMKISMSCGGIVGIADLVANNYGVSPSNWALEGYCHWELANARAFKRVVWTTGALGLWEPRPLVREMVQQILDADELVSFALPIAAHPAGGWT